MCFNSGLIFVLQTFFQLHCVVVRYRAVICFDNVGILESDTIAVVMCVKGIMSCSEIHHQPQSHCLHHYLSHIDLAKDPGRLVIMCSF